MPRGVSHNTLAMGSTAILHAKERLGLPSPNTPGLYCLKSMGEERVQLLSRDDAASASKSKPLPPHRFGAFSARRELRAGF
ncbi:Hypothetical predicted protein [Podarcis lilfordi]|uniref:Uncharacterized protein n=1 Tax=Podarcis lilfordi TaxID=74358 RepID=A0AA35LA78_9SAUR|nr:Hypothetical predicted protein [Podarcis lilfordi]